MGFGNNNWSRSASLIVTMAFGIMAIDAPPVWSDTSLLISAPGGVHKKVIISADGVTLHEQADDGSPSTPTKPFEIFFLLWPSMDAKKENKEQQGDWLHVGDPDGNQKGWIKNKPIHDEESLIPWNTRFLLDPRAPEVGRAFTITGGAQKFEYKGKTGERMAIAPILDSDKDGEEFEVAFFAGKVESQAGSAPVAKEKTNLEDLKLEIVFVIDTTASMTPLIEATKDVVRQVAGTLGRSNPEVKADIRFGLVQYQDATPGLKPSEVVTPLVDLETFQQRLAPLTVANIGSEEDKEDVLAGLVTAIDPQKMQWSTTSNKHIILLGDASAHLTGPKNTTKQTLEGVVALGRKPVGGDLEKQLGSITFHAVRAIQKGADPMEQQDCRLHFQTIAQNNRETEGFIAELDPNDQGQRTSTIERLTDFLRKGFMNLGAAQQGDLAKLEQAVSSKQNTQIVESLYKAVASSGNKKIPPVLKGKAALRTSDGHLLAARKLLVAEGELRRVKSTLDFLYTNLESRADPGSRGDVSAILGILQQMSLVVGTGEKQLDPKTPLQDVISELPLKTDALKITAADLAAFPAAEFKGWLDKLQGAGKRADDLLAGKTWIEMSDKPGAKRFTYVRIEEMP